MWLLGPGAIKEAVIVTGCALVALGFAGWLVYVACTAKLPAKDNVIVIVVP